MRLSAIIAIGQTRKAKKVGDFGFAGYRKRQTKRAEHLSKAIQ